MSMRAMDAHIADIYVKIKNKNQRTNAHLTSKHQVLAQSRVVNLGTTTKLCKRNIVPKPHPGHVVVVARPKI